MKRRLSLWIVSIALTAVLCTLLRADDAPSPTNSPQTDPWQSQATHVWFLEHYSTITKDPESMGVAAVYEAVGLMQSQTPEAQAEYFKKMLFNTRSHAVQRAIRMQLIQIYKTAGRTDEALDQVQELLTDTQ